MTLALVRHCHAVAGAADRRDIDRELTPKGRNMAHLTAEWLEDEHFTPDVVLCSPSQRTRETLHLLAETDGVTGKQGNWQFIDRIYEASLGDLVAVLQELDSTPQNVLLIGHNPSISALVEWLRGEIMSGELSPGDAVILKIDASSWKYLSPGIATLESVSW